MLQEVQRVYRLQGVEINDKHIEMIVRQMLKKIRIEENGDSNFLPGAMVDILDYDDVNEALIAEGKTPAEGKQVMLGITKASLATDIAVTEKRIVGDPSTKDCSVYISIPFCPTRCTYCSFVSYTSKRLLSLIPEYLVKLKTDIKANFDTIKRLGLRVRTVYIGGGTPSVVEAKYIAGAIRQIKKHFTVKIFLK